MLEKVGEQGWFYREVGSEIWKESANRGPTDIYSDLVAEGRIPDPFIDKNEDKVQWVATKNWEYRTQFRGPSSQSNVCKLIFQGLDTFSDVFLNGSKVLSTDNMFKEYVVDLTSEKLLEINKLLIVFHSPLNISKQFETKHGTLNCWNGDSSRLYVRKAQYHFGWDWGPRLITMGPFRPIEFVAGDTNISSFQINTSKVNRCIAQGTISCVIDSKTSALANFTIEDPSTGKSKLDITLPVEKSKPTTFNFSIDAPRLWYPVGLGEQFLYTVKCSVDTEVVTKKYGFRKVELIQKVIQNENGKSFYFEINDCPIQALGSSWIPGHSFINQMQEADYTRLLELAVKGNHNMVRVWGGGMYEAEFFYSECDRLGLMVWQDFMFACGQYLANLGWFRKSVYEEVKFQVLRLLQFCSVAVFVGNNEDYNIAEAYKLDWNKEDDSGKYLDTSFPARTFYESMFPKIVEKYSPSIPYHPGSPWGGKNTSDSAEGDIHQWNVWHGTQEKYQDWFKLGGRFVSEFGMESLPSKYVYYGCISDKLQLYPQSEFLDHHNKALGFEHRLPLYVWENFRIRDISLKSWIYVTQLMQADCVGFAFKFWRRKWNNEIRGRETGGCLVWQLNDCWPVASWSIIDYHKCPKLSYFSIKRECKPVQMGIHRIDGHISLWVANSLAAEFMGSVKVLSMLESGKQIQELEISSVVVTANLTSEIMDHILDVSKYEIVRAILFIGGKLVTLTFDWPQPIKHLNFGVREVEYKIEGNEIVLWSDKPIKGVFIESKSRDCILDLDDNGFDMFPKEEVHVHCENILPGTDISISFYEN